MRGLLERTAALDSTVALSATAVRDAGSKLGFPREQDHAQVLAENQVLKNRVADLERENNEMARELEAIDGLTKGDYVIRKKTGRPLKKEAA